MIKKSNQINKILARKSLKECDANNKVCNKSNSIKIATKDSLYKDLYGDNTSIIELKHKDFTYNKKTKSLQCKHPLFQNIQRGLVIFYAPWCKHCNDMYDDLIELSINYMNVFPIAVVNIEDIQNKNDLLTIQAKVSRYPTMKVLNKDLYLEDYNNDLTKDNITYFINMNL
jgi:thiol-disulfide isomerase/thioredoxin